MFPVSVLQISGEEESLLRRQTEMTMNVNGAFTGAFTVFYYTCYSSSNLSAAIKLSCSHERIATTLYPTLCHIDSVSSSNCMALIFKCRCVQCCLDSSYFRKLSKRWNWWKPFSGLHLTGGSYILWEVAKRGQLKSRWKKRTAGGANYLEVLCCSELCDQCYQIVQLNTKSHSIFSLAKK